MQNKCNLCGTEYDPQQSVHPVPNACVWRLKEAIARLDAAEQSLILEIKKLEGMLDTVRGNAKADLSQLEERHVKLAERVTKTEATIKGKK